MDSDPTVSPDPSSGHGPQPTNLIEGYEILHEIHRGGQGVVYKAVQRATKRTVALKVLLQGPYASPKQQRRFEREIDLVASIQHPNIVTVFDSGVAQGRYYFAMEYVHGQSLDQYLARTELSIEKTLRLFQKICAAVNCAHQRGVIHRDLKPANIRVDASGEPHVLDFGLAKAAGPDLQDGVPVTLSGEFMGTLAYASPEQTSGDPALIDVRTDIYSLGVILFEMLTGEYPYQVVGAMADVLRNIAEVEPRHPSTIRRQIDDEVETIVLQALAKEKERRYQSAEALASDVGRYLAGEPLDAKRDSTWYLLSKSLRRYRLVAGLAAVLVLVLAGSTVGLSVLYRNQRQAHRQAELARVEAQERAAELEIVTEFQQSLLGGIDAEAMGLALYADLRRRVREDLAAEGMATAEVEVAVANLDGLLGRANATDVALQLVDTQMLERAAVAIETDFANQPIVRAALLQTVAETSCRIGRYPRARSLQAAALNTRRAELGDDHPSTLVSLDRMGHVLESMGDYDEALAYYTESLAGCRRVLGDDHPQTLTAINNLGLLVHRMGRLEEARGYYEEALAGRRRILGDEHQDTLTSVTNLGSLFESMGMYDEALAYYRQALEGNRRVLGDDHPETFVARNNLANLLQTTGEFEAALRYHREALDGRRRVLGSDHPETLVSAINLGALLLAMDRPEAALESFREALAGWRRALGEDHPRTLVAVAYVGVVLKKLGRLEEAEPYFRAALDGNRRTLGADHENTVIAVHNMGKLLRDLGRLEEAEECGARAVAWARVSLPAGHPKLAAFLVSQGVTQARREHFAEAEASLTEAHGILEAAVGSDHRYTIDATGELVELYEAWHAAAPDQCSATQATAWRARLTAADGETATR